MVAYKQIPLPDFHEYSPAEMQQRSAAFLAEMRRRTIRHFSDRPLPRQVIADCLLVAGTAPNSANLQPWSL
jgi:iodotyrosine deiodinase